jgi:hypothetical protein
MRWFVAPREDVPFYPRKLQRADLLAIPLLLKMMRNLVRAQRREDNGVNLGDERSCKADRLWR